MTNFRTNRPDSANKVERRRFSRNRSGNAPNPLDNRADDLRTFGTYPDVLQGGTYDYVGTKRRDAGPIGEPLSHGRAVRINDEMSKCHGEYASLVKHPNLRAQFHRGADSGDAEGYLRSCWAFCRLWGGGHKLDAGPGHRGQRRPSRRETLGRLF